ncbi:hypothetical protein [Spiroplasma endosymbiont of Nebria brevicollis]|uniref:hypothetical protein n=1 Tax=Spiroplasma endosymbiont of Nebria brevicollis TaxID=3066284 RepID=UPI00313C802F
MWILFGVGIIFDLIISSIAILLSLVMNAKAIIATMIGFAALLQILSSSLLMNQISAPTREYMQASQAATVYSTLLKVNLVLQI